VEEEKKVDLHGGKCCGLRINKRSDMKKKKKKDYFISAKPLSLIDCNSRHPKKPKRNEGIEA